MINRFEVTILGSSSALPTSHRNTTAQLVNHAERFFLLDCGEGTQIQLRRFKVKFFRINHIFISHLHGDHFFGLPGLLNTYNLLGRTCDLHIYGPESLQEFIEAIKKFILHHLSYELIFHALNFSEKTLIYENKLLNIYSFPVEHKIPTCGFLFEEKKLPRNIIKEAIDQYKIPIKAIHSIKNGADYLLPNGNIIPNNQITVDSASPRKYAFCTDTAYNENIIPIIKGSNLLYHEATFLNNMETRAQETKHSTAGQAGLLAQKSEVKKLMLGHFSSRYKDFKLFKEQAAEKYDKEIIITHDGMTIVVT